MAKRSPRERSRAARASRRPRPLRAPTREVLLVGGGGPPLDDGERAVVALDGLEIGRILSGPERGGHEGTLRVDIGPESTQVPWRTTAAGKLLAPDLFEGNLLHVGALEGPLGLRVELLELDVPESTRDAERARKAIGFLAGLAAFAPGAAPFAGGAGALVAALVDLVRGTARDQVELSFHGSLGDLDERTGAVHLETGSYRVIRRRTDRSGPDEVGIGLRVGALRAGRAGKEASESRLSVLLESVDLSRVEVANPKGKTLLLEAVMGRGRARREYELRARAEFGRHGVRDVLGVRNRPLYEGTWTGGLPYAISLTAVPDAALEEIDAVIQRAVPLVAAVRDSELAREGSSRSRRREERDRIEGLGAAALSLRSLAAEMATAEPAVGRASGLLFRAGRLRGDLPEDRFHAVPDAPGERRVEVPLRSRGLQATVTLRVRASPDSGEERSPPGRRRSSH